MANDDYVYLVESMEPEEFIRKYALLITQLPTLKFALMLACGDELNQASRLALGNDVYLQGQATQELIRLGFMKRKKKD